MMNKDTTVCQFQQQLNFLCAPIKCPAGKRVRGIPGYKHPQMLRVSFRPNRHS